MNNGNGWHNVSDGIQEIWKKRIEIGGDVGFCGIKRVGDVWVYGVFNARGTPIGGEGGVGAAMNVGVAKAMCEGLLEKVVGMYGG